MATTEKKTPPPAILTDEEYAAKREAAIESAEGMVPEGFDGGGPYKVRAKMTTSYRSRIKNQGTEFYILDHTEFDHRKMERVDEMGVPIAVRLHNAAKKKLPQLPDPNDCTPEEFKAAKAQRDKILADAAK